MTPREFRETAWAAQLRKDSVAATQARARKEIRQMLGVEPQEMPAAPAPATGVTRPSKAAYGLSGAAWAGTRGDCRRRQVGAMLIDTHNRVIATGYNGAPPGFTGCLEGGCPRGKLSMEEVPAYASYDSGPGMCISAHAEANCLLAADPARARGATLSVTDKPCFSCTKLIANFADGLLASVVWPGSDPVTPVRLLTSYLEAR